jgi:chromosome segregation ATPase
MEEGADRRTRSVLESAHAILISLSFILLSTLKYMEQLVASLEAQKRERDEELGAQRHLVQTLQRELREKEQEVQGLREMVVHLRTRVCRPLCGWIDRVRARVSCSRLLD